MAEGKELIVQPGKEINSLAFVKEVKASGVRSLFFEEMPQGLDRSGLVVYSPSRDADVVIVKAGDEEARKLASAGRRFGVWLRVHSRDDLKRASSITSLGAESVIFEAEDWKIIPLENLIAELHRTKTKVFAKARDVAEIRTLTGVLEVGVDGIIFEAANLEDVKSALKTMASPPKAKVTLAKITEVREVGMGERVCVDTASMLLQGQGLLVGSRSNFLFLIHNESFGSSFTSPRPFRVNAGSVHNYVLLPNGKTGYLSELEAGSEVLIARSDGEATIAVVGRSKIERRPLSLIKAEVEGEAGSILVQNAETIRFMGKDGSLIPVTSLKPGDEVVASVRKAVGRHFGAEVDEFIIEK